MLAQDALNDAHIHATKLNEELRLLYQTIAWLEGLIENDQLKIEPQDTGETK